MEKKIFRKKLLAILMIISLVAADFFVLSSNLVTYADEISTDTNNENVEFLAYFKNSAGEQVQNISESIKNEKMKLFAKINILTGYLNEGSTIEIQNSNFNLKSTTSSSHISAIEGNKITLKQISKGETEIALDIEPIISDTLDVNMLTQKSTVKLNGTYTGEQSEGIQYGKEVSVSFIPDEKAKVELETSVITNKVLSLGGTPKRVVQLLLKSRLQDNQYPVEQTTLKVNVPTLSGTQPEVSVLAIDKLATNGATEISSNDIENKNGELTITINNKAETTNYVTWNKDCYDQLVITYIYADTVDITPLSLTATSAIKVFNIENPYTTTFTVEDYNVDGNNVIMATPEITTSEMYKGQLYANINATEKLDVEYDTTTKLVVTNVDIDGEIIINEGTDKFVLNDNATLTANTKYIITEINKEKALAILGDTGRFEITNGTTTTTINKAFIETIESENIVIDYGTISTNKLQIKLIEPVQTGVLELKHLKAITGVYSRENIRKISAIKTTSSITGTDTEEKPTETSLEIKDTISKAELSIENNKQTLSTTEANEMTLGITLVTAGTQYDLYSNPEINIQFPASVEKVELNTTPIKQNATEFSVASGYNPETRIYKIKLTGEQTVYAENESKQTYLQLNLNVTLSKLATTQTDKITMTYTNKNASLYDGNATEAGVIEKTVAIDAQPGLIKMFNLSSNEDNSLTQEIKQQITNEDVGKTITLETILVNNTNSNMSNVKILGKLPTSGNVIEETTNTLETILKNITAENGTIYYTPNVNATSDVTDSENSWSTDSTNAKMYLIEIGTLNIGSNYITTTTIQIPNTIGENLESYTQYEVIYDTDTQTEVKETSRKIGLVTYVVSDIEVKLTAQVGPNTLNQNDVIKEGEIIKYTATVTNNSSETLENVELKVGVPNGTSLVIPIEESTYLLNTYYQEITDENEKTHLTTKTIPTLAGGQSYTIQYEVRVNTDIVTGTGISNKAIATFNNTEVQSTELSNKLEESDIRVSIKKAIDKSIKLTAGSEVQYDVIIENFTNQIINLNELDLQIASENFELINSQANLTEIPTYQSATIKIKGKIKDDAEKMEISAVVADADSSYRTNVITEELVQADAVITLTSPQNGETLTIGDIVEYKIVAKNTGKVSEYFKVYCSVPNDLAVQTIIINGKTKAQASDSVTVSNLIYEGMNLDVGEVATIKITAQVKQLEEIKIINTTAKIEALNVYKDVSQEITHTLSPEQAQENVGNIISGNVWLDANKNGQKDNDEAKMTNVKVKIYDKTNKTYLLDDNGNVIETISNENGIYTLTEIPNGSYIVIFEYDTSIYDFTTSFASGVDTSINSKAQYQNIEINGETITVVGIEVNDLQDNITNINIGLKGKTVVEEETTKSISGIVWLDINKDGKKEDTETVLSGIKVKIYDIETKSYLKYGNGNIVETTTNSKGEYFFTNIEKGSYVVIFDYDMEKYEPTEYLATEVDTTRNSKATINTLTIDGKTTKVTSTDMIEVQEDKTNINLGLKEKVTIPTEDGEDDPKQNLNQNLISGFAWLDTNRNGRKDEDEITMTGIKVKIYNIYTQDYLKDNNGKTIETVTDAYGKYVFNNMEKGSYILLFEYDTEEYEPTVCLAQDVDTTQNSKVILKTIKIGEKELVATVTDIINLEENVLNLNIGLKEKVLFDLELNKYISRIVVQTSKETKAYDYENSTFEKVEIHRKQIQGSLVVLEYTINVKNNGQVSGYARNIIDYLPQGLEFNSELNKDWYISEGNLHTKSLENVEIKPNEEKTVKLILTKAMTAENTGLINNRAEIYQQYNQFGANDINSTPNNQVQNENDLGVADVIIGTSTGGSIILYIILIMTNIVLICVAVILMIRNGIIRIPAKEERR